MNEVTQADLPSEQQNEKRPVFSSPKTIGKISYARRWHFYALTRLSLDSSVRHIHSLENGTEGNCSVVWVTAATGNRPVALCEHSNSMCSTCSKIKEYRALHKFEVMARPLVQNLHDIYNAAKSAVPLSHRITISRILRTLDGTCSLGELQLHSQLPETDFVKTVLILVWQGYLDIPLEESWTDMTQVKLSGQTQSAIQYSRPMKAPPSQSG